MSKRLGTVILMLAAFISVIFAGGAINAHALARSYDVDNTGWTVTYHVNDQVNKFSFQQDVSKPLQNDISDNLGFNSSDTDFSGSQPAFRIRESRNYCGKANSKYQLNNFTCRSIDNEIFTSIRFFELFFLSYFACIGNRP